MATTTMTRPVGYPQPKQIIRQAIVIAALVVIGAGLGMLLDTDRNDAQVEAGGMTRSQLALANRLQAQSEAYSQSGGPSSTADVPEHGAFTGMVYRDPSVLERRFGGQDANLDPDVVVETDALGRWLANATTENAALDPDVFEAHVR